jgi:hypothetical protein
MLFIYGCPIPRSEAAALVGLLLEDGSDDALNAAGQIQHALMVDRVVVGLAPNDRDAVLHVLDDAPSELQDLRDSLSRDHAHRYSPTGP